MRFGLLLFVSFIFSAFIISGCKDKPNYPEYRGERGESCESRNDCASGLACVMNKCVMNEFPISVTASECVYIECTASSDCCPEKPDFLELDCSKPRDVLLVEAQECLQRYDEEWGNTGQEPDFNCDDEERAFIEFNQNHFNQFCTCNKTCDDNRCVNIPDEETADSECKGEEDGTICNWGSSVCHNEQCVQCGTDQHCQESALDRYEADPTAWYCTDKNICGRTCYNDSNCGMYKACDNGVCVETDGCTSDRECAFGGSDVTAFCNEDTGECEIECSTNLDCNPHGLTDGSWDDYVCDEGICVFVGCENDQECQARRGYSSTSRHNEYVCRPIEPK